MAVFTLGKLLRRMGCLGAVATGLGLLSATPALAYIDASVDAVFVQGQVPAGLGRHAVQARITNTGTQTIFNLPVTLDVTGANFFLNVKTVPSLAVGASTTVIFDTYAPTVQGYDDVTVYLPTDTYSSNNLREGIAQITANTFAYTSSGAIATYGYKLPDNGQDGIMGVKLTSNGAARVTAISAQVPNYAVNVGQPLTLVVMSANGSILARSAQYTIQQADLGGYKRLPLLTPVTVQGDFLIGALIDNNQYFPVGSLGETPPRSGAFFLIQQTTYGGPPNNYIANNTTTMTYLVAELAAAPACANPTNLTAQNVTGTSASLTFDAGLGNTSYTVSYGPAGGPVTQTLSATSSPVNINGLVPGAAYVATVTGSCGSTPASPPAQLYFGTVPPNDQCAGSNTPQLACGATVTGSTLGSTNTNDPTGTSFNGDEIWPESGGVFYRITGTGTPITLNMCSSALRYDAQLFVLTGSCGNLNIVASDDDGCGQLGDATMSLVTFPTVAGTNYYVYVTGYAGGRGEFSLTATCGSLPDLVVSSYQTVAGGAYRNVTVTGPATGGAGTAYLTAPLNVAGTLTIQNGGTLMANCHAITGNGSFTLAAGGALGICDAAGITLTDNIGAVRVSGARSYSSDATYIYDGVSTQVGGDGLPTRVRGLTVNNAQNLTMQAPLSVAQVLRLTTGNLVTGGNALTLLSTATGTALVHHEGTGNVTGTATVQRYLTPGANTGLGYRHYSSPVASTTVADLGVSGWNPTVGGGYNTAASPGTVLPFPTVYAYDQARLATAVNDMTAFDKGWFTPASAATLMGVGRGYTVNLPATALVDFRGTLNTGNVVLNLSRGPATEAGWAFVGNPYAAPLNWSLVTAGSRPGVMAAMYVYESSGQYAGSYRSYTNGIGVGNPEIPSAQGFFVRVAAGQSAGTLTLRNTHRVTTYGPQTTFRRAAADLRPVLHLTLSGGNAPTDDAFVYFESGATPAIDAEFDAEKIMNPTGLSLYSEAADGLLAINGLSPAGLLQATVVPLGVRVPVLGTSYTLAAAELRNLSSVPGGVWLLDAATGQRIDLRRQPSYTFSLTGAAATTGIVTGRFSLQFGASSIVAGSHSAAARAAGLAVYPNPAKGRFSLTLPARATAAAGTLVLTNSLGQTVLSQPLALPAAGLSTEVDASTLAAGVYALSVCVPGQAPLTTRVVLR
ncbi:fibronectin type III domain-containing protein [Hymenobacter sp. ASUV-10]|uniref:Fibronectin type III domain-containing protein n=1 Tax=Hymenobacter aranciens TaxID=3063996 RepID=A0ABT9B908_9BACT|nr:fibronectin type III domain-containing protein [Hymenobacter sp. ASUV-10]MDO7874148.1 fibronectin type III domain-containing protein [Hymenobacter sp. ASUV-10]